MGTEPYPQNFAENTEPDDDPSMIDVYAGPRPVEDPEQEAAPDTPEAPAAPAEKPAVDPRIIEGVYAGPRMMNVPPMAPVYAGPEMMEPGNERVRFRKEPRMEALYAAPRRPDAAMRLVYAGPAYFKRNSQNAPAEEGSVPAQPRDTGDDGKESVCPSCGTAVPYGKFCIECGALLPAGLMIRCPQCGSVVGKTKFCAECGAPLAGDEKGGETE